MVRSPVAVIWRQMLLFRLAILLAVQGAFVSQAQTLHAILVADTRDPLLAKACAYDIELMHRQLVQITAAIDYQLAEQRITHQDFSQQQLDRVVRALIPRHDDILVFYYSGHGYHQPTSPDRFPTLMLIKEGSTFAKNPGLRAVHTALKQKKARLCITLGDCCNNIVSTTRGMINKRISPKALVLTNDSLNAAYRKLFLNVRGDALIASSEPPQQSCAHPDSGSFYTRAFDEALELASRYNKTISWESLLRDAQTRLTRHAATSKKVSLYELHVMTQQPSTITLAESNPLPNSGQPTQLVSFDQVNYYLNALTDERIPQAQRYALMHNLTTYFTRQARIDIYVNSTLGEMQPIEQFVQRLLLNAHRIERINLIERLSEVAADGRHYRRAAIQEIW